MIVNAAATLTALGGSIMPEPVIAAMGEASRSYVDLPAAYTAAGRRIAELTGNDDAVVTSGASAAITLAVAALVTGPEPETTQWFPLPASARHVVMLREQRNDYDLAVRILGIDIREAATDADALRAALSDDTVCVLWFAGTQYPAPGLALPEIVAIAGERSIPVIVDAAAQIPPRDSMRRYTAEIGAAAAIFSGGKGLGGPQDTGVVVGRREITDGIRRHMAPNHGVGRGMKVTKESLAGILAAVEHAFAVDEERLLIGYETIVEDWIRVATAAGLRAHRVFPSEAGQPHGRAFLTFDSEAQAAEVKRLLWERQPQVAVLAVGPALAFNPQPLGPGEETEVAAAIVEIAARLAAVDR